MSKKGDDYLLNSLSGMPDDSTEESLCKLQPLLRTLLGKLITELQVEPDEWEFRYVRTIYDQFDALVDQLEGLVEPGNALSRTELALALALAAVGPQGDDPPPAWVWQDLAPYLRKSARLKDGHLTYILDATIAYGCGWHRSPETGADTWSTFWKFSVIALQDRIYYEGWKAWIWLGRTMENERWRFDDVVLQDKSSWRGWAYEIAHKLMHDRCDCAVQRPMESDDRQEKICTKYQHKLSSWEIGSKGLWQFVAEAVHGGTASGVLVGRDESGLVGFSLSKKTDAYKYGMLYPYLAQAPNASSVYSDVLKGIGLHVGTVEFKVCFQCSQHNEELILKAREKSIAAHARYKVERKPGKLKKPWHPILPEIELMDKQRVYEGEACPACGSRNAESTYRYKREKWLYFPEEKGGTHRKVQRWMCDECGNLSRSVQDQEHALSRLRAHLRSKEAEFEQTLERIDQLDPASEQFHHMQKQVRVLAGDLANEDADLKAFLKNHLQTTLAEMQAEVAKGEKSLAALRKQKRCVLCGGELRDRAAKTVRVLDPDLRALNTPRIAYLG